MDGKKIAAVKSWLELLLKTNYIDEANYQELNNNCSQIRVMLIKSINTAKEVDK